MHRIKSLNECENKSHQVNYQDLMHFDDINSAVPEELVIKTMSRPKPIPNYHYNYNRDIKQILGEK